MWRREHVLALKQAVAGGRRALDWRATLRVGGAAIANTRAVANELDAARRAGRQVVLLRLVAVADAVGARQAVVRRQVNAVGLLPQASSETGRFFAITIRVAHSDHWIPRDGRVDANLFDTLARQTGVCQRARRRLRTLDQAVTVGRTHAHHGADRTLAAFRKRVVHCTSGLAGVLGARATVILVTWIIGDGQFTSDTRVRLTIAGDLRSGQAVCNRIRDAEAVLTNPYGAGARVGAIVLRIAGRRPDSCAFCVDETA